MKVLLRNPSTGLYFQSFGNWVKDANQAKCFSSSSEALNAARYCGERSPEVLLYFGDAKYDVCLPCLVNEGLSFAANSK